MLPLIPLMCLIAYKAPQIGFEIVGYLLGLSVNLRVVCRAPLEHCTLEIVKASEKALVKVQSQ